MKYLFLSITFIFTTLIITSCGLVPPASKPTSTPAPSTTPYGYEPKDGDDKLRHDPVFIEMDASQLVLMESYPIQVSVILKGNLPDPCHELRVQVIPANAQNEIYLNVYSVVDSTKACITVLQPFNVTIPLGSYKSGHYSVYVDDQLFAEFDS
jgi:hypothetical protein